VLCGSQLVREQDVSRGSLKVKMVCDMSLQPGKCVD